MTGKTHVAIGVATAVALIAKYKFNMEIGGLQIVPPIALGTVALGSYLPDIDIPQSHLGRQFPMISKHLKHRGITHTLLFPAILLALTLFIEHGIIKGTVPTLVRPLLAVIASIPFGLFLGWIMHIIADMFNSKGVPLFWPLSKSKIHIASVKTRSWQEYVFAFIVIGGLCIWTLANLNLPIGGLLSLLR